LQLDLQKAAVSEPGRGGRDRDSERLRLLIRHILAAEIAQAVSRFRQSTDRNVPQRLALPLRSLSRERLQCRLQHAAIRGSETSELIRKIEPVVFLT
jgi:hypothetical protein